MSRLLNLKLGSGARDRGDARDRGEARDRDGGRTVERQRLDDKHRDNRVSTPKNITNTRYCSSSPEIKRSWLSERYQFIVNSSFNFNYEILLSRILRVYLIILLFNVMYTVQMYVSLCMIFSNIGDLLSN